jgi:perosamine synthetase
VKYAVAVNSGTSALHLLIRALDIGPGDEVITTPFSFIASTNCILFERATPVFVDIEPETLCIDPALVERAITSRTKAILAVDVFGHPADLPAIEEIAKRNGLWLIEDSAESLGSTLGGRPCGSFGDAGVFAFYPNKQITTGEGGAVVTDDARIADLCRSMADQGRGAEGAWLHHVRLGYNYRLDEMSAALGLSQLARLEEIVAARVRVAGWYVEALTTIDEIVLPKVADDVGMSWFVFVVRLADRFSRTDRDRVLDKLRDRGIGCRDYFTPIHLQPYIREALGTHDGQFAVTEHVCDRTIALPFYSQMTLQDVHQVSDALRASLGRGGAV